MKKSILLFLIIVLPILAFSQNNTFDTLALNSFIVTPLGDLLNNSKSSIYYRRVLSYKSNKYLSVRIGTELFNSVSYEFSNTLEEKSSSVNFKFGVEMGKKINKMVLYAGPELSYTITKINNAKLLPAGNAIFSTESIMAEEWDFIDESSLRVFSLIGFVGFKYQLLERLSVGIESAVALGLYQSEFNYDSGSGTEEEDQGNIRDLAVNRFITLEYSF